MKILFFGSDECDNCKLWISLFNKEKFPVGQKIASIKDDIEFVYIDAFSDNMQDFCDNHSIDDLPRVKIYDKFNRLLFDKEGFFDPGKIWKVLFVTSFHIQVLMDMNGII